MPQVRQALLTKLALPYIGWSEYEYDPRYRVENCLLGDVDVHCVVFNLPIVVYQRFKFLYHCHIWIDN